MTGPDDYDPSDAAADAHEWDRAERDGTLPEVAAEPEVHGSGWLNDAADPTRPPRDPTEVYGTAVALEPYRDVPGEPGPRVERFDWAEFTVTAEGHVTADRFDVVEFAAATQRLIAALADARTQLAETLATWQLLVATANRPEGDNPQ